MIYAHSFLVALVWTIVAETLILFFIARKIYHLKESNLQLIFAGFFCSFATIPYVWFVFPAFIANYWDMLIFSETAVVLIEAIIYKMILTISWKRALCISAACNLFSVLLGLFILPFF